MDVKELLARRLTPRPVKLSDPDVAGALFVRRLRVSELQRYLDAISGDPRNANLLLLSMCVCDAEGGPVFAGPEEVDKLLGDLYVEVLNQACELALGSAEGNSTSASSPRGG